MVWKWAPLFHNVTFHTGVNRLAESELQQQRRHECQKSLGARPGSAQRQGPPTAGRESWNYSACWCVVAHKMDCTFELCVVFRDKPTQSWVWALASWGLMTMHTSIQVFTNILWKIKQTRLRRRSASIKLCEQFWHLHCCGNEFEMLHGVLVTVIKVLMWWTLGLNGPYD